MENTTELQNNKTFKSKLAIGTVIFATVILAGVAVFTATRLYQLRETSISPILPESEPQATGYGSSGTKNMCQILTFTITTQTGTPTSTPTSSLTPTKTPTPTQTPTPTTPGSGGGNSPTPTSTQTPTPTTVSNTNTPTNGPTNTPTQGQGNTATPTPTGSTLPDAGVSMPTVLAISLGFMVILLAIVLAL